METADPRLRVAAMHHHEGRAWSIAIVNRNPRSVPIRLDIEGPSPAGHATLTKYVFDPAHVPQHPFGDLPAPVGSVALESGKLSDRVGPGTLTVYTSRLDTQPPAAVHGLNVQHQADGRDHLTWTPSPEPDLCYYRVYRGQTQLGSTVATNFDTDAAKGLAQYRIVAVDQEGNAGPF